MSLRPLEQLKADIADRAYIPNEEILILISVIEKQRTALAKVEEWNGSLEIYASVAEVDEDEIGMLYHIVHSANAETDKILESL